MSTESQILARFQPSGYYFQGNYQGLCGGYAIHAVLDAYGCDDGRQPWNYEPTIQNLEDTTWWDICMQKLGITTPQLMRLTLSQNGLKAVVRRANATRDRLRPIKNHITEGHPVIMLVGNPHLPDGGTRWVNRLYRAHWLSVWGFEAQKNTFYLQDSFGFPRYVDNSSSLPIGNVQRTAEQIISDWRGTLYTLPIRYVYVAVRPKRGKEQRSTTFDSVANPQNEI